CDRRVRHFLVSPCAGAYNESGYFRQEGEISASFKDVLYRKEGSRQFTELAATHPKPSIPLRNRIIFRERSRLETCHAKSQAELICHRQYRGSSPDGRAKSPPIGVRLSRRRRR